MEAIDQQVINDNKDIYAKIESELRKAEFEILIATAWFTDHDLFQVLQNKLTEGVRIELVISDNQENEKLDFSLLTAKGAAVYKIKMSGYGVMNQKFCVIDQRIALHGSYNWTMNAKKNNQESIISTNHQETIRQLMDNFQNIKTRIQEQKEDKGIGNAPVMPADSPKSISIAAPQKAGAEFERVLDSMIAAEVGSFDRKLLREQGYDRCKANHGDQQVLPKALDTLYSVFINDIDVIEDKKKRLIARIDEQRVKTLDNLTQHAELQIDHLEREYELNLNNFQKKRTNLEAEQEITRQDIGEIKSTKLPFVEQQQAEMELEIRVAEQALIRPAIKWFDLIPTAIIALGLLVYLFIFYSSSAYILLFSVAESKSQAATVVAQIFNPKAVSKVWKQGGTAPYFIFLFALIPLTFSIIDRFITQSWAKIVVPIIGIILLDVAVAYKVTEAVYEVNYIRGIVDKPWTWDMAYKDANFYLVFVFGAAGLFLFKFVFKKLMHLFEDRSPDMVTQRHQMQLKQLKAELDVILQKILNLKNEAAELEKKIIQLKADTRHAEQELAQLPVLLNQERQKLRKQLVSDKDMIDKIAVIYTVHVQSDNLPISVDALKDRINVFLEGWNDYLYQEYAVVRAMEKTAQAQDAAHEWQQEKMNAGKIDKRVKLNVSE